MSHSYTYTGAEPRVLTGLSQGVNAEHFPSDGAPSDIPDGATIEVHPGDTVKTDEPYPHALLVEPPADAPHKAPKRRRGAITPPEDDEAAGAAAAADEPTPTGDAL